jgi:hypothetical protein
MQQLVQAVKCESRARQQEIALALGPVNFCGDRRKL